MDCIIMSPKWCRLHRDLCLREEYKNLANHPRTKSPKILYLTLLGFRDLKHPEILEISIFKIQYSISVLAL